MNRVVFVSLFFLLAGCSSTGGKKVVSIFHAGSLSVPFKQMERAFEQLYPDIDIQLEAAGSVACARKITDLKRECDIMASADYQVIDEMLIPAYTSLNIRFATNSMVIAYSDKSVMAESFSAENWPSILLNDEVVFGRSDPNSDPCGYRTLMTMQLSEKYYNLPGLESELSSKDHNMIRPKEVDLIALLETGAIDYFFIYKSVAVQHNLRYIDLPSEIDLSDPALNELYSSATVDISGKAPGETVTMRGGEMVYGITLLDNAPARDEAILFLNFVLGEKGRKIMTDNGQAVFYPPLVNNTDVLPESLKHLITE